MIRYEHGEVRHVDEAAQIDHASRASPAGQGNMKRTFYFRLIIMACLRHVEHEVVGYFDQHSSRCIVLRQLYHQSQLRGMATISEY